jgi:hypothetical protein
MARRAFDFVGDFDDNELFLGGTDEHRIADLAPAPPYVSLVPDSGVTQTIHDEDESDDDIRYRFGFGARAEEEEWYAEQKWADEDDS